MQLFNENILAVSTSIVYFIPQKAKLNLKTGTSVQNMDCLLDQAREQLDPYPVDWTGVKTSSCKVLLTCGKFRPILTFKHKGSPLAGCTTIDTHTYAHKHIVIDLYVWMHTQINGWQLDANAKIHLRLGHFELFLTCTMQTSYLKCHKENFLPGCILVC